MTTSRLEQLQKFLADEPGDAFTHYAIGLEYSNMGKAAEALAKFEEVIVLNPEYIPAYHQLGLLFARHNRKEEALAVLKKGIAAAVVEGDTHAAGEMQETVEELEE
jgi:tetratricopeptide (TPR) repeat protein